MHVITLRKPHRRPLDIAEGLHDDAFISTGCLSAPRGRKHLSTTLSGLTSGSDFSILFSKLLIPAYSSTHWLLAHSKLLRVRRSLGVHGYFKFKRGWL